MKDIKIDSNKFKFKYLPDFADHILKNVLDEFVLIGIRFCRDEDLPMLKPFAKMSETELVTLSVQSSRQMLESLSKGEIAIHILENSQRWITNSLGLIDKTDISAEDLTLAFYVRRKTFAYFLDGYTKNVVEQKFIISELDAFTTQEELISYSIYMKIQQEKLIRANADLDFYKTLLLEAQELDGTGSFSIDYQDPAKSVFTPEYKRIFEIEGRTEYEKFMEWVHPQDKEVLKAKVDEAYKNGGTYEMEYRYIKSKEKRIWAKGFIIVENGKPVFSRGIVREIR